MTDKPLQEFFKGLDHDSSHSFLQTPATNPNAEEILKNYQRTPNDTNDPSYSRLTLPYSVICRQRYRDAGKKQRDQFVKEVQLHERLRLRALDGVRIHREFCNPIINHINSSELVKLTEKQKERIEKILSS